MRLAADYQQKTCERTKNISRQITKLGFGLPSSHSRKRGISLSKKGSLVEQNSLDKKEVSLEKKVMNDKK